MSISITINDINNLTETERDVLRLVANRALATSLQQHVRQCAEGRILTNEQIAEEFNVPVEKLRGTTVTHAVMDEHHDSAPKDPDEVVSPHTIVQTVDATAPTTPTPASAELDSQGLPWDKRIHSSSRAKIADGSWRKFRGVDAALVAEVEAELRAVQAAPAAPAGIVGECGGPEVDFSKATIAVDAASGTDTTVYAEVDTRGGVRTVTVVPPPPAATTAVTPPPPPPATTDTMTFAQMMQRITPHIVSGAISQERVNEVCVGLELPHLAALGARPDLIPAALAALEEGVTV